MNNPRDFRWFGKNRLKWFWATFFLDLFLRTKTRRRPTGGVTYIRSTDFDLLTLSGGPSRGKWERTEKWTSDRCFFPQDVAIPVGPKVSLHTAETLERNIENELKENAGRPRYVVEWRHGEFFFAENGNVLFHLLKHFIVLLWLVGMYMSIQMYIYGYIWYTSICVFNINVDCLTSTFSWCIAITGALFWKVIFPLKKMRGGPFQCFL